MATNLKHLETIRQQHQQMLKTSDSEKTSWSLFQESTTRRSNQHQTSPNNQWLLHSWTNAMCATPVDVNQLCLEDLVGACCVLDSNHNTKSQFRKQSVVANAEITRWQCSTSNCPLMHAQVENCIPMLSKLPLICLQHLVRQVKKRDTNSTQSP